jgi:WG containing repeat
MNNFRNKFLLIVILLKVVYCSNAQYTTNLNSFMIPYNEKGNWGYCDTSGKVLLNPIYDSIGFFIGSNTRIYQMAITKKNNKYGVLGKDLKEISSCKYDQIQMTPILPKDKDKSKVYFYSCLLNQKWGVRSNLGKQVIAQEYDKIDLNCLEDGYLGAYKGEKCAVFDLSGKKISDFIFNSISPNYSEDLNKSIVGYADNGVYLIKNGRAVFSNSTEALGNDALESTADGGYENDINPFSNRAIENTVRINIAKSGAVFKEKNGVDTIYADKFFNCEVKGIYVVVGKAHKKGIWNLAYPNVVMTDFDEICSVYPLNIFGTKYWIFGKKDGKWGAVNELNETKIHNIYDGFADTKKGFVETIQNGRHGIEFVFSNRPAIPCKYDSFTYPIHLNEQVNWWFEVYSTSINGEKVYVGENGVEYYKL